MNIALAIIFFFLFLSVVLALRAKKGKDMNLEQWAIGGRGFGTIFVFILMAGEIYSTATFLGVSGWAYGKGGPAFHSFVFFTLSFVLAYWFLPPVWKYAKEHNLMSQSDFFVSKYESPYLGILVSIIGVVAMIPYLVLQFKGLGIIVSEASYGSISSTAAIWIGAVCLTFYVMISGVHGSAWTAVVKDSLIILIVIFLGIYLPVHYFGGVQPMFEAVQKAKPNFLILPSHGLSVTWFISTVIMSVFGCYMWPHMYISVFSAKNAKIIRKNSVINPLYSLMFLFIYFVGFTAILMVPGLKGGKVDLSLLRLSIQTFDPWFVGLIGGVGLLAALVPGSMLLMAISTTLSKNVYKVFVPAATDRQIVTLAKCLVPFVVLLTIYFVLNGGDSIIALVIMGYSLVSQLFPAMVFSLMKKRFVTKQGAAVGMIFGVLTLIYFHFFPAESFLKEWNSGLVALLVNFTITAGYSLAAKQASIVSKVETEQSTT